jgi:putative ABC transport system permease protein
LVLRQGLLLGALGVALGLAVALIAAPALGRLVYGLSPRDPLVLVSAATTLLIVVVIASYLPARRAAAIDPIRALQEL